MLIRAPNLHFLPSNRMATERYNEMAPPPHPQHESWLTAFGKSRWFYAWALFVFICAGFPFIAEGRRDVSIGSFVIPIGSLARMLTSFWWLSWLLPGATILLFMLGFSVTRWVLNRRHRASSPS